MQTLDLRTPTPRVDPRTEIDDLVHELHHLVALSRASGRTAIDRALPAAARLQVATANVDACNPSRRAGIDRDVVAMADARLRGLPDAIERSLAYTAESTMRRLLDAE